jgi:threonine/homoserine/homoserine lactone efflux protein
MIQTTSSTEATVRIIGAIVLVWLVIGALAAGQRGYYRNADKSCASTGTAIVTIVAGPLNYVGANPKVHCKVPQPSS